MNKNRIKTSLLISIAFFFIVSNIRCVEEQGYKNYGKESVISQICDITWASEKVTDENGSVWQTAYKFNKNGTYTKTNIKIENKENKKGVTINGLWSFSDSKFRTIYFGREHYWDIVKLTKNEFSFYDRSGDNGDPFMNRQYTVLIPYKGI